MGEEYQIVRVEEPEWSVIGGGISAFNKQQAGKDNFQRLCFVVQAPDQEIVGGVIGETYWNWLHIDLMWIKEEHRRQGYGQRLLAAAEEEARQRGITGVFLDTFSFQAPGFYERYGYRVFGELADFPPGHTRFFMTKEL